eukprot:2250955-Karenia_brevis.AAC.1
MKESEAKPQLDKLWNKKLIQGPVAEAMHGLILHCSGLVHWGTITLEHWAPPKYRGEWLHP